MHFQQPSSTGPAVAPPTKSLSFGQNNSLAAISGPTYLTAQTLVQQVAYSLSQHIFAYSPDTFDLDGDAKAWNASGEKNAHGEVTGITASETRTGAGSVALGYVFSKDFDLTKRHIPQAILASSGTLSYLRPVLDQLSLLYDVANPFVAHVAAVDYSAATIGSGLMTDYTAAITIADDLGLGLVASSSAHEIQHMALLATLISSVAPAIHVYDGVTVGRETTRVIDILDRPGLLKNYQAVLDNVSATDKKRLDQGGRVSRLLKSLNDELGTDYKLFEYEGHPEADTVLVVFGTVEASLTTQIVRAMAQEGTKIGVINVRVYRPFVEEDFLQVLPSTVQSIAVVGQVKEQSYVLDDNEHSALYSDVLAASAFATHLQNQPAVYDFKYPRVQIWTPSNTAVMVQQIAHKLPNAPTEDERFVLPISDTQQYSFWDLAESRNADAPSRIAQLLSGDSKLNVTLRTGHDNLVQGGVVRTDIRSSTKSIQAAYSITSADVAYVGSEKLLSEFDVFRSVKDQGTIVLRLEGYNKDELEKRLPVHARKALSRRGIHLVIFDPTQSQIVVEQPELEDFLLQLAFLQIAREDLYATGVKKLAGGEDALEKLASDLEHVLAKPEVPEAWLTYDPEEDKEIPMSQDLNLTGFASIDKNEPEDAYAMKDWTSVAKALAFKEAYGTSDALRPDLTVKTATIHVKERRRLTPANYDRNIFHIEFDLGDSGLKYDIGEALGIHAENDKTEVENFIKWYGLNANDVVEVPSREDPAVIESRTVYQSLLQNIDIFGRPPKRFYEALSEFADDEKEKTQLLLLGTGGNQEAQVDFKRRAEVDTITYADLLLEFPSAHPSFHDIIKIVAPMKRREYSVASSQHVTPNSISLLIVTVNWVDPKGRDRFGQATRYLNSLPIGSAITVSVKPSVMKLPPKTTQPIIMAGLGTGLAPFRAFVQERAWQKQQGMEIGSVLLYMGSRHQREEYLYGEEWEAYRDAGIITLMGCAFSRDQPQKIYIQDRMRETLSEIRKAYLEEEGAFYLCGPTWPVPDVTDVLEEAITVEAKSKGKKVDAHREIDVLKEDLRYVLEVY
ncbi:hypothetical protein K461DRAFT_273695 [Myriangium duriaei CBS 260.36]|uniref:assimilatory sulfite reductase (NADPH) n=1 Tax=Myriangium duriaei CBS 260.36 TaxID=1168546 RepID=A0A9P4MLP0_9PEZI|nr:hypothetical protein K461DRAFT_273695 [Myriangium duriaei CBS 260.36]